MFDRLKQAFRWLDERLSENAYQHGAHLIHEPAPLIVRHPFLGARIVTPLNNPPKDQRHSRGSMRKA